MSLIQRAYKTELDLNNEQTTACRKHAGAARWAYNWGLARKQEEYKKAGTSPSAVDLHRELNALKQTDVSWMYEVSKCAPQEALRNLDTAFTHFFRRVTLKQQDKLHGKVGYPQFKSLDTPPHKCGRFSVLRRSLRHASPKGLPGPLYVLCRVVVPMQTHSTVRATVPTDR
jgi:putative transposase